MQYITYSEYTENGGELSETAFNKFVVRASGIITNATFGRIENMTEIPLEAKVLCGELIDTLAGRGNLNVASRTQSAGAVSESETYKDDANIKDDIDTLVYDYLYSVITDDGKSVLYRGDKV